MRTTPIMVLSSATTALAAQIPTVAMPLYLAYGPNHRVAVDVVMPYSAQTIEINYDLGSSDFWLFQNNSIMNWGCPYLTCQGQCNVSVPADISYDPALSSTASSVEPWEAQYGYGGGLAKLYKSNAIVNDTFTFTGPGGKPVVVPDVQVALAQYLQQRIRDNGTCSPVPVYSRSILGVAPYVRSSDPQVLNTTGPSFRQNLLEQGQVSAPVHSLWFEKGPEGVTDTWTGVGLLGGIDTSKYVGPLVKIPKLNGGFSYNEYYTYAANVSFNGTAFENATPEESGVDELCIIDSGAGSDGSNPVDQAAFLAATGLRQSPGRIGNGQDLAWPGPCDSIPVDQFMEYSFTGVDPSEHVTIKVPLRAYARYQDPADEALGWCTMSMYLKGCGLSQPFVTAAFFAADDEMDTMALAQGGVAEMGSGVDDASVVLRIP